MTANGDKAPTTTALFNELLKRPEGIILGVGERPIQTAMQLWGGSAVCYLLYGAAVGFFGGGQQIAVAAMKAPLIIFAALLLCTPSFYVFTSLAGSDMPLRESFALLSAFAGVIALLLLGLMPITWLFSVSSRSTVFVVWMEVILWVLALLFARRFLSAAFPSGAGRRGTLFWAVLFLLVSFQMTTTLRPVFHEPGQPLFTGEKMSFFQHLSSLDAPKRTEAPAPHQP